MMEEVLILIGLCLVGVVSHILIGRRHEKASDRVRFWAFGTGKLLDEGDEERNEIDKYSR